MRRRDLLAVVGGAAILPASPIEAQPAMPVVGYLGTGSLERSGPALALIRDGLKQGGYTEGRNVAIEFKWADGRYERLPALAAELVALKVAVIVAMGTPAARAAQQATRDIPIVFQSGIDVVQHGLVASLHRPGGNATGVTFLVVELSPKRLELLHELVPSARSVAYLRNPDVPPGGSQLADIQKAASVMGLTLQIVEASSAGDIDAAFAHLARQRPDALIIASDWLFLIRSAQIAELAAQHAIPAVSDFAEFVVAGGLASYGPNVDLHRTLGIYTARVLAGEKPADLPVQQVTKFELVVNLRAAKALGLTVPATLLERADKVIE